MFDFFVSAQACWFLYRYNTDFHEDIHNKIIQAFSIIVLINAYWMALGI